jgi:hypothetical protein
MDIDDEIDATQLSKNSQAAQEFSPAPEMDVENVLAVRHFADFSYASSIHNNMQPRFIYQGKQWESYPFRLVDSKDADPHTGVVFQRGQKIIVAFHGSDQLYDWIQDFKFSQKSAKSINLDGMVHTGFSQILESVISNENEVSLPIALSNAYQNGKAWPYEYIFTGHSLGGALATLSAGCLTKNAMFPELITQKNQVKVVNFSSPNIGDFALIEEIENKISKHNILCFANEGDIVTYSPPPISGYSRAGIWIDVGILENIYGITHSYIENFSIHRVRLRDVLTVVGAVAIKDVANWIYQNIYGSTPASIVLSYTLAMHSMPSKVIVRKKFLEVNNLARRIECYEDLPRVIEKEATMSFIRGIF